MTGPAVPEAAANEEPSDREPSDRALLAAHLAGDAESFGLLFGRHRDRLWAVAVRTSGDREEAADALQDAMISAFRRAESFRGDSEVTTWLHRIVVNACLDRIRRRKVRAAEPLPDDLEEYAERGAVTAAPLGGPADHTDPADAAVATDQRRLVLAALDTLPPDQKAALVLVDMEGYSVDEAAAILSCPSGTIKSRCSRGRGRLAPLLAPLLSPSGEPAEGRGEHGHTAPRNQEPPASVPSAEPPEQTSEQNREQTPGEEVRHDDS